jgi:MFS superfamily sulfate permease-like transporter
VTPIQWKNIRLPTNWAPGLSTLRHYQKAWLLPDLMAGLALTAILVPVGMGYAEASGLPAVHGLYATIIPLIVYAIFGPSRILVLGPDSTLTAVIAALILPMAAGSVERAVLLAGMLAILSGLCSMLIGLARLGLLADLLSKPIRIGFLNAIALTVLVGQLPKILGVPSEAGDLPDQVHHLLHSVSNGQGNGVALAVGGASLILILLLARWRPRWPGLLLVVLLATAVSAGFDLANSADLSTLGRLPQGLPD